MDELLVFLEGYLRACYPAGKSIENIDIGLQTYHYVMTGKKYLTLQMFIANFYPKGKLLGIEGDYFILSDDEKNVAILNVALWKEYNLCDNCEKYIFSLNEKTKIVQLVA